MDIDKDKLKELMDKDKDFDDFWRAYQPDEIRYPNRKLATYDLWRKKSKAEQSAMLKYVQKNGSPEWKNPFFFVLDFIPRREVLSFDEYYSRYGTTEEKDGWTKKFLPEEHKTIYVKE